MIGLDVFKEYFKEYTDQYVLIGGAACNIIFEERNSEFRSTKDLDMVLIVEALSPEFGRRFWQFVRDGGYENKVKSNGSPQFYRFNKPKTPNFPYMIELFSKTKDILNGKDVGQCVSLFLGDEISSLSAILLNKEYYSMLLKGRLSLEGITVLSPTYLILFKVKAWLDLRERKDNGLHIDEKNIRKHKNDVVRLATLLTGAEQCELSEVVHRDISIFIEELRIEPVNLKDLNISGIKFEDILTILYQVYLK